MSHNHSTETPVLAHESDNSASRSGAAPGRQTAAANPPIVAPIAPIVAPIPAQSATQSKAGLRHHLLQIRRDLDAASRAQWDMQIGQQLLTWYQQHDVAQRPRSIGLFCAIQAEPNLLPAYRDLAAAGVALSLPIVIGPNQPLRYARWQPGMALVAGAMSVPVPAELEWVALPEVLVIPCVGHNLHGYRLGYGGGYYDRTLAQTPRPRTIGVSYPCLLADFAADEHDIALDMIFSGR